MGHILVLPEDLRVKLNAANLDANTHNKWVAIGVNTVDDMINRIVNQPVFEIIPVSKLIHDVFNDVFIKRRIFPGEYDQRKAVFFRGFYNGFSD